jgi:hypothetical protein
MPFSVWFVDYVTNDDLSLLGLGVSTHGYAYPSRAVSTILRALGQAIHQGPDNPIF